MLFAVGLGLPLVYFGMFFSQVNMQALQRKLDKGRPVYTVRLHQGGITVVNDQKKEDPLTVLWKDTQRAFRAKSCIYLYVSASRAFLLPDGQADAPQDEVWDYLTRHMGKQKCKAL